MNRKAAERAESSGSDPSRSLHSRTEAGRAASRHRPNGIGLGLRWEFLDDLVERVERVDTGLAFLEVSPENYIGRGGHFPRQLDRLAQRLPVLTHGLSLSLGGTTPPDDAYLRSLAEQVDRLHPCHHSEHLCFSNVDGFALHDLLPIRFSRETAHRVAERMQALEARLRVPVLVENISWYAQLGASELSEADFINEILEESGGNLLLDVNNIFVNARNHRFDAYAFLDQMPFDRVAEIHVAGHTRQGDGWIIDTHGAAIVEPVYELLRHALRQTGPVPVLLERDNDIPGLDTLLGEVHALQAVYSAVSEEQGWEEA